ncbi:MAG: hypothetical protein JW797_12530 [Bradymonadales bacterium]|nr:hypothetical protein [Bradymonadales bacterium]
MRSDPPSVDPTAKKPRWQWLKDAFSRELDYEPLTDQEVELLDRIARFTVRRHLAVPAILFLESVRPMNYLGSQVMAFFEPAVKALFTAKQYTQLRLVLEKRQSIEILLQRIEQQETTRMQAEKSPPTGDTPPASADPATGPPDSSDSPAVQADQHEVGEDR